MALVVVRIIARLNIGGPARHCAVLARGLAGAGDRTVLAFGTTDDREGSLESLIAPGTADLVRVPELGRRIKPWSDVVAFTKLLRLLRTERPDVVHTHTAKAGALGRVAAAVYNLTSPGRRALVVHTFHGHVLEGYFGTVGSALARFVERVLSTITDRIVTISERQRTDIVERFRVARAAQAVVVPLGLDLDAFANASDSQGAAREELGIPADAFVIGFVGRLVPIKAPEVMLDAFAALSARVPGAHLLVVGDGPLREAVERRASASGGRVHLLGWRHDLPRLYGAVDAVALTSDNEGTPVALIEAMAAGRPVVATSVGGVPDVVVHGRTGLVVPPRDSVAVAAALEQLAGDAPLRRALGLAAREHVLARYGAARLVSDIRSLYRSGLAQFRAVETVDHAGGAS